MLICIHHQYGILARPLAIYHPKFPALGIKGSGISDSKGYIHKQIDKKQDEIRLIEHKDVLKYGLNGRLPHVITKEDEKKEKLQNDIEDLERKL